MVIFRFYNTNVTEQRYIGNIRIYCMYVRRVQTSQRRETKFSACIYAVACFVPRGSVSVFRYRHKLCTSLQSVLSSLVWKNINDIYPAKHLLTDSVTFRFVFAGSRRIYCHPIRREICVFRRIPYHTHK